MSGKAIAALHAFPALDALPAPVWARLGEALRLVTLPPGTPAFASGSACEHYLMLCTGSVRVQLRAANGREVVLYRVGAGETCVLTTACLLAREAYSAEAVSESEVQVLLLPRPAFESLLAESPGFRDFVFAAQASRPAHSH